MPGEGLLETGVELVAEAGVEGGRRALADGGEDAVEDGVVAAVGGEDEVFVERGFLGAGVGGAQRAVEARLHERLAAV